MKDLMKNINEICKKMSMSNVLMLVGVIALAVVLCNQSKRMGQSMSGYENQEQHKTTQVVGGNVLDNGSDDLVGAPVSGYSGPQVNGSGNCGKSVSDVNASELLPKNAGGAFNNFAPNDVDNLNNVQLLKAGHNMGINTVSGSLRNANLQLRSEPINPQASVGPWAQSTIPPDTERKNFEIGN